MTGMDRYDDKRKRAMRRRNHIARDLADKKYRQRRIDRKLVDEKVKYGFPYWDDYED